VTATSTARLSLTASDGTPLSAVYVQAPRPNGGAVVLLPGFWRRAASPRIAWLALELARRWDVFTLDFRGHGLSSGRFTFGVSEHQDVLAVMQAAASRGADRAVLLGLSMGGAAGLITLGSTRPADLPLPVRALLLLAPPAAFGDIRPRPWRGGRRRVAWEDARRIPRIDWRFPFTQKRSAAGATAGVGDVPVRLLHGRRDWLVDDSHSGRLAGLLPHAEHFVLDLPGALHADELLAVAPDLVLRLTRAFVDAAAADAATPAYGTGAPVDPAPWAQALGVVVRDPRAWSPDLGNLGPAGTLQDLGACEAGRDGVHLAFHDGSEAFWARGLRDGSVHGLNLLGNALAADGPSWPAAVRAQLALRMAHGGRTFLVGLRGAGGFSARERARD